MKLGVTATILSLAYCIAATAGAQANWLVARGVAQSILFLYCPNNVDQSFPTGGPEATHWSICWREVSTGSATSPNGLVIGPAYFRKSPSSPWTTVLWDMRVSDFFVPYSSGSPRYYDLSGFGFTLTGLSAADCPASVGGTLLSGEVCKEVHDRGLLWKDYTGVRRGEEVKLWGAIDADNYRYVEEFSFRDDGTIVARAGATGQNLPGAQHEAHMHNPLWRVDMDLGGSSPNSVNHISHNEPTSGLSATDPVSAIPTATGLAWSPQTFDALQVVNPNLSNALGDPTSYELVPLPVGGLSRHNESFTQEDFWVTRYNAIQFAAADLPSYVAGSPSVANTDIVLWYKGSMHHIPSDEDGTCSGSWNGIACNGTFTGTTALHWSGFMLVPNDLFDCSPLYHASCP